MSKSDKNLTLSRCAMGLLAEAGYLGDSLFKGGTTDFKGMKKFEDTTEQFGAFFLRELISKNVQEVQTKWATYQEAGRAVLLQQLIDCDGEPDSYHQIHLIRYLGVCHELSRDPLNASYINWARNIEEAHGKRLLEIY